MANRKKSAEQPPQPTVTFAGCRVLEAQFAERKTRPKVLTFGYDMEIGFRSDGGGVRVVLGISGHPAKEETKQFDPSVPLKGKPVYKVRTECRFTIRGLEAGAKDDEGRPVYPQQLITTVITCAFGATRGMAILKAEGTVFADVIPPIMSLRAFLPTEIELDQDHGI